MVRWALPSTSWEPRRWVVRAGLVALPKGRLAPRQRVVSVDGEPVRTAAGRTLAVDGALGLRGLGAGDVLVLPGLGMATAPAIAAALERPDIVRGVELVARAAAKGVLVAASCSATFVLAASRVLDGRRATTTWWWGPTFAQRFPRVTLRSDRMVVESGGVFTAGSAFAHADLMLAILAHTLSPSVAHTVARYLVLDERASQARYMVLGHLGQLGPGHSPARVPRHLQPPTADHDPRDGSHHGHLASHARSKGREGAGYHSPTVRTAAAGRPGGTPARDNAAPGRRHRGACWLRRPGRVPARFPPRDRGVAPRAAHALDCPGGRIVAAPARPLGR